MMWAYCIYDLNEMEATEAVSFMLKYGNYRRYDSLVGVERAAYLDLSEKPANYEAAIFEVAE